jgi:hypothetical protein
MGERQPHLTLPSYIQKPFARNWYYFNYTGPQIWGMGFDKDTLSESGRAGAGVLGAASESAFGAVGGAGECVGYPKSTLSAGAAGGECVSAV